MPNYFLVTIKYKHHGCRSYPQASGVAEPILSCSKITLKADQGQADKKVEGVADKLLNWEASFL